MTELVTRSRYGFRLMASWVHLAALVCMGLVLFNEVPPSAGSRATVDGAALARIGLRMVEVYLPVLAPVIAASILDSEQRNGTAELAATFPGSLRRVVLGRFALIVLALAVVMGGATAWVVRAAKGELLLWRVVKAAAPTIWVLSCATVLGSVLGGVLGGFGLGIGWWALDLLTGGTVTRRFNLFLFGDAFCST